LFINFFIFQSSTMASLEEHLDDLSHYHRGDRFAKQYYVDDLHAKVSNTDGLRRV